MATNVQSTKQEFSPHTGEEVVIVDQVKPGSLGHAAHKSHFLRHLLDMTIAIMAGMVVGGALLGGILGPMGKTLRDARVQFTELFLLGMGFSMTVPMVVWMRHRGHGCDRAARQWGSWANPKDWRAEQKSGLDPMLLS